MKRRVRRALPTAKQSIELSFRGRDGPLGRPRRSGGVDGAASGGAAADGPAVRPYL